MLAIDVAYFIVLSSVSKAGMCTHRELTSNACIHVYMYTCTQHAIPYHNIQHCTILNTNVNTNTGTDTDTDVKTNTISDFVIEMQILMPIQIPRPRPVPVPTPIPYHAIMHYTMM